MKLSIAFVFSAMLVAPLFAEFEVPHILVYGTAESKVTPDELYWNIAINTKGKEVESLAPEHLKDVGAVLDYLKASGIADEDVKTSHMQLNENWEYRNQSRLKTGYFAFTAVSFKTIDFDAYVNMYTELAKLSNLSIQNVHFGVSNYIEVQKDTRIKAVKAAKQKAQELAVVLGSELAEPLLLEEITPGMDSSGGMAKNAVFEMARSQGTDTRGGVSPGQESISMRVKVVYRITGG